jgi:signal peptidase
MEIKRKSKNKVLKIILETIFWVVVGIVSIYSIMNGIDQHTNYSLPFFGYRQSVILSDSMSQANPTNTYLNDDMNRINKFDVILTKNYSSFEEIEIYDVITYVSGQSLICHRVVDKYTSEGIDYIVTRGDANNVDDTPFAFTNVRGKVIAVVPNIGTFIAFIQSPYLLVGVCGSLFFVFLGIFIIGRYYTDDKDNGDKAKNEINYNHDPNAAVKILLELSGYKEKE